MAFRDLVMGGGGSCSVPGTRPSTSNPLSNLADSVLGSSAKTQERVRELPGFLGPAGDISGTSALLQPVGPTRLPGSEVMSQGAPSDAFARDFMQQYRGTEADLEGAWGDVAAGGRGAPPHGVFPLDGRMSEEAHFASFEGLYGQGHAPSPAGELALAEAQHALSGTFRNFFQSAAEGVPFFPGQHALPLPQLPLSTTDKTVIRDRSSILARHLFHGKDESFLQSQVATLLGSLAIDAGPALPAGPMGGLQAAFEDSWRDASWQPGGGRGMGGGGSQWADEFATAQQPGQPWAQEFAQEGLGRGEGSGFSAQQLQERQRQLAREQSQRLVDTLQQDANPKVQGSKFLEFVSKFSRGELVMDSNGVKEVNESQRGVNGAMWGEEFDQLHGRGSADMEQWANQFAESQLPGASWARDFISGQSTAGPTGDQWANEFQTGPSDWAHEFGQQQQQQSGEASGWLDSYSEYVDAQLRDESEIPAKQRWIYEFSPQNPYVGRANPMMDGRDLFEKGLLSEAVLALEAEVLKNADHGEAWRLLGLAHAENDDDRQAIAAMVRAKEADPTNLNVLLSLGVSHTNELEQAEALEHLSSWLQHHSQYSSLAAADARSHEGPPSHSQVTSMFLEASRLSPDDADVHTVLGVLFNLSREYEQAIAAFRAALRLRPHDHSLWNKLGATQANSTQSAQAIEAYQKALDLKPNYVRAWSNMGIAFANQGRYEESITYYVRALAMNPKADNAWQYLRISLSCAGKTEQLAACDNHDLDALQSMYPI